MLNLHAWLASLGASLAQPIFHGGALRANWRASIAAYDIAAADYFQTVLMAFQDVANSLEALKFDAKELRAYAQVAIKTKNVLDISIQQYELGGISQLDLLDVKRQYIESLLDVAEAKALRLADTVALFQALGGAPLTCEHPCQNF